MKFKGVDKKTAMMVMIGYIMIAFVINLVFNSMVSMLFIAVGMIFSGGLGIKNNTYVFIRPGEFPNTKSMNNIMLYMNYLLLFLGAYIIIQQF